jgi:SAM-dependent methyltransferase
MARVTPSDQKEFLINGYSYTAGRQVDFVVDFQHSAGGRVNWRESVACPLTFFNNRMRAAFHLFDLELGPYPDIKLYVTEQVTPIFVYFKKHFSATVGSEYLGDKIPLGAVDENGVRNEDLCALTFPDNSFDSMITLDVLEHIPDFERAFKECARVLTDKGKMIWSVPFVADSPKNLIRARLVNGEIIHAAPPEYHGDPLSAKGVLCFQHFGWEMLDQMLEAGFRDAYALCYQSNEFGYIGDEQLMFVAVK